MVRRRPRVSVLLPVRDAGSTLEVALDSIRSQTLSDLEVVAVDDGSLDDSREILERQAAADARIRVVLSPRRGIVAALEAARAAARAPILARMDADDRAEPVRLEAQLSFLERHPQVALCGTHVRFFPRDRVAGGARRYEAWLNSFRSPADLIRDLFVECPLAHPTFMMNASALAQVGGYREVPWPEDYDLLLRLWTAGAGLGVVSRVLLHWREGADRLSRTDPRYSAAAFRRIKLHFLARTLLRERDGLVIWGAGPVGKAFARDALRRHIRLRAFVDVDPRKLGQQIHGAPVIPPTEANRFRGALSVAAVSGPEARARIRSALHDLGWEEGRDFVAVA